VGQLAVRVTPVWVVKLVIGAVVTWTVTSGRFDAAVAEVGPSATVTTPVASTSSAEITSETPR
jgi:hypothetical protein